MALRNNTPGPLPLNPNQAPVKLQVLAQPWFRRRLQWFMLCRVVVASFFLGTVAIVQVQGGDSLLRPELVWIYALTVCVYMLSLLYVLLLPALKDLKPFVCVQIAIDLLCIAVLLLATGGIDSMFAFMFSVEIIAASILLYWTGGLAAATVASLLYSALVIMQRLGYLVSPASGQALMLDYSGVPLYFPIIVNTSSFYLIALLASFLADQNRRSRRTLAQQLIDISNLEALNENIIQSITGGLITLDLMQRIVGFNRAASEITGLTPQQVRTRPFELVFPSLDLGLRQFYENGRTAPLRIERSCLRADGAERFLGFSISILRDSREAAIGIIISFQDLTGFRELQNSLQRMDRLAAMGRLAADFAHEVRNPLASISGSVQVLRQSLKLSHDDERLMDIIVRESSNLSQLIADFSRFARPESKDHHRLVIKDMVDEVLEMFKNSPEYNSAVSVINTLDPAVSIKANEQQFRQLLWNLLLNASQATGDGDRIEIDCRTRETGFACPANIERLYGTSDADWVELQISDTGIGIPKEVLDRIFDPFYTTKDRGFGLGLSIVQNIMQEHNGLIMAESTPGKGTAFYCYFIRSSAPESIK
jgi:two-component system sensor histidine kinase PilS (NtrC family)